MTDTAPILQAASGMSWLGVVFALAFFGYAVFYVGKCAYAFRMMWKSAQWPTVNGTIVSSTTVKERDGGDTVYDAKLQYEYRVGGTTYHGDRREWSGGMPSSFRRWHERIAAAYPVGRVVTVHYDPADPARAVLEPRRATEVLITVVLALVLAALVVAFAVQ